MNTQRYFVKLSYKGTHFFGWQIQPNAISVQETIAIALKKLNRGNSVKITGCGRTDTGVHASTFFAHFDMDTQMTNKTFAHKLNCMLPNDIAIQELIKVPSDLHARFSATSRTYHYYIHTNKNPFLAETSWLVKHPVAIDKMNAAAELLLNHTNFKCFSKTTTGNTTYQCNVTIAKWETTENGLKFTIKANRFLRNMVRAIVGTLINIGMEKISLTEFKEILNSDDRNKAGESVPAQGLFLANVNYANNSDLINS